MGNVCNTWNFNGKSNITLARYLFILINNANYLKTFIPYRCQPAYMALNSEDIVIAPWVHHALKKKKSLFDEIGNQLKSIPFK